MKLDVVVEKDEAGYFVAEVPALPGCLSQGKTEEEALTNIRDAVDGWRSWSRRSLLIARKWLR
jgi:predicted RNase H-like HicB family nuclease